jgi:hypothetical protein
VCRFGIRLLGNAARTIVVSFLLLHHFDDLARWGGGGAEHGGIDSLRFFAGIQ